MVDKFDIYDLVGILVPGVLVVAAVPMAFPSLIEQTALIRYPDGFALLVLTALSVFVGHLIQALGSLVEPFLNKTWGGRPSDLALTTGLGEKCFPLDSATRIRTKLLAATSPGATDGSLFLFSSQLAASCGSDRVRQFNALYAYHRALIVLTAFVLILFVASLHGGFASTLTWAQNLVVSLVLFALLLLFWHRAKQRGWYYVREVLLCAERQLASTPQHIAAQ